MTAQFGSGFRLFNQFAVFVYCQLQSILPDSFLGDISNWDHYLKIDLTRTDLPFKTSDEFVLNVDYHRLVISSKLPRPSKFIDQTISFCKSFCGILLSHEIIKSDLVRGLSSFDSAVVLEGSEEHYISAIEYLTSHFLVKGWITVSDKSNAVSQYRAFVTKLRVARNVNTEDWFQFLSSHYELQNRSELYRVFKYASLCLPSIPNFPEPFVVPISDLGSDADTFQSCVRSLQVSFNTVPNVASLYRDPRSISRVFRLLGRGPDLIHDKKFSIWNFMKSSATRRQTLQSKLESAYRLAVAKTEDLCLPGDSEAVSRSESTSSASSLSPKSLPGRITLAMSQCEGGNAGVQWTKNKSGKGKKN